MQAKLAVARAGSKGRRKVNAAFTGDRLIVVPADHDAVCIDVVDEAAAQGLNGGARVDRDGAFELFGLLGSADKRMHVYPGLHAEVPPEGTDATREFLAAHL